MPNRLVVSLSGVWTQNVDRCARFVDELGVPVSLLARPAAIPGVAGWLASRVAGGDCAVLHGFGDDTALPGHETRLRLIAVNAMLEDHGLPVSCFAVRSAPADMRDALRRFGFRACADATGVHDLVAAQVHPARPVDVGRGEQWRRAAALVAVGRLARRSDRLIRLSVRAEDLGRHGVISAVRAAVELVLRGGAQPMTLLDLASPAPRNHPRHPARDEALWSQTA